MKRGFDSPASTFSSVEPFSRAGRSKRGEGSPALAGEEAELAEEVHLVEEQVLGLQRVAVGDVNRRPPELNGSSCRPVLYQLSYVREALRLARFTHRSLRVVPPMCHKRLTTPATDAPPTRSQPR
jgi:hypothetical protein